jgi:hypothetical protein
MTTQTFQSECSVLKKIGGVWAPGINIIILLKSPERFANSLFLNLSANNLTYANVKFVMVTMLGVSLFTIIFQLKH